MALGWIAFFGTAYSINRLVDGARDHRPKTDTSYRNLTIAFIVIQAIVLAIVALKGMWVAVVVLFLVFAAFHAGRQLYRNWTLSR